MRMSIVMKTATSQCAHVLVISDETMMNAGKIEPFLVATKH